MTQFVLDCPRLRTVEASFVPNTALATLHEGNIPADAAIGHKLEPRACATVPRGAD